MVGTLELLGREQAAFWNDGQVTSLRDLLSAAAVDLSETSLDDFVLTNISADGQVLIGNVRGYAGLEQPHAFLLRLLGP